MTVVDSSAVVASLLGESTAEQIDRFLDRAGSLVMGAPTLVELSMVMEGRIGEIGRRAVERFLDRARVEVIPFDDVHASTAVEAWRGYGKGNHPARLNFGDCCSYAVAKLRGEPLLCVGDDFTRTDLELVPLD